MLAVGPILKTCFDIRIVIHTANQQPTEKAVCCNEFIRHRSNNDWGGEKGGSQRSNNEYERENATTPSLPPIETDISYDDSDNVDKKYEQKNVAVMDRLVSLCC